MLLSAKGLGGERFRKRREYYRHVRPRKSNASELYDEASKSLVMSKRGFIADPLISAEVTCLLSAWHPALRQRESGLGQLRERENLHLARIGLQGRTDP